MNLINQSFEIVDWGFSNGIDILKKIERIGRVCYKSEDKITDESCISFVKGLIKSGHHSVIEHHNVTVKFITDRGITHELVRHRLAAYSQESTRYCNYSKIGIGFIFPSDFELTEEDYDLLKIIEGHYNTCLKTGRTPQQARYFLPNGLKTEIITTANLREWRHIFNLRCSNAAHPQIRELMLNTLVKFYKFIPVVFDDIYEKYIG